jgi:hypothetical protein
MGRSARATHASGNHCRLARQCTARIALHGRLPDPAAPAEERDIIASRFIASREMISSKGYRGASGRWRRLLARVAVAGRHLYFSLALI